MVEKCLRFLFRCGARLCCVCVPRSFLCLISCDVVRLETVTTSKVKPYSVQTTDLLLHFIAVSLPKHAYYSNNHTADRVTGSQPHRQ